MPHPSRKHNIAPPEQLELRILPTVKVNFNPKNGLLKVTGDKSGNRIDLNGNGTQGFVDVRIENVSFDLFEGVRNIKVNLKGGNDLLFLNSIQIEGDFTANLGNGTDELDVDDDNGSLPFNIGGFFKTTFGGNAGDFAEFDDSLDILGDVILTGVADVDIDGDGTSRNAELNDVTFHSDLIITFSGLGDSDSDGFEFDCDNLNVSGTTLLIGSSRPERLEITRSRFQGNFTANLDDGDDFINMNNGAVQSNLFISSSNFDGGNDNDTFLKGGDNLFSVPETVVNFETVI